ncbi:Hypp3699 [Branchiostoma lanceolatum]|uniref:Hypp3699 protein n=1 Tax=Branchiostoma lanceolatum TaxID=7740 RepID=A0A8K0ESJ8_BRALA|nr:Hypp3699 [Branchiostoma lanceolatum]
MGGKVSKQTTSTQESPETATVRHTSRKNTRFAKLAGNAGKMKKRFVKCFSKGDKSLNNAEDIQDANTTAVAQDVETTVVSQTKQPMDSRLGHRQQNDRYAMMILVVFLTLSILDWARMARRFAFWQRVELHRRRLIRVRRAQLPRHLRLTSELHVRL